MKKLIVSIMALALLCGCGGKENVSNTGGKGGGSVSVSATATKKSAIDTEKILAQLETTPYTLMSKYEKVLALVIKNNSSEDFKLSAKVSFKDADGNLLGVDDNTVNVFGAGGEICLLFRNDESFYSYEYEYTVDEKDEYYEAVNSDLSCEATIAKDKVIVSVTNNGEKTAKFVTGTALFFEGDKMVGNSFGYISDSDSEIKPGNKESEEIHCFTKFDSAKVYLSGYAEKEY